MGKFIRAQEGLIVAAAAAMFSAGFATAASADAINATVLNVNGGSPYETVDLTVTVNSVQKPLNGAISGVQHWRRNSGADLGKNNLFNTYCIEILQEVVLGHSYDFTLNSNLADAPTPGSGVTPEPAGSGMGMGTTRANMIAALWDHAYAETLTDDTLAAAFQSAIWEIVYETNKDASGNVVLNATQGNFFLRGSNPTAIVADTQNYLGWVSANYQTASRAHLVALTSADYQDQITAVPLPTAWLGGFALLGGLGLVKLRSRSAAV